MPIGRSTGALSLQQLLADAPAARGEVGVRASVPPFASEAGSLFERMLVERADRLAGFVPAGVARIVVVSALRHRSNDRVNNREINNLRALPLSHIGAGNAQDKNKHPLPECRSTLMTPGELFLVAARPRVQGVFC